MSPNDKSGLKDFLELSYEDLERLNLEVRSEVADEPKLKAKYCRYLADKDGIKAITVCFSDIEGRLHMLDYDKDFFLASLDNLTFDGSSIVGLSKQAESDLRLEVDWTSLTFVPADVFGAGKVIVFANVLAQDGRPYATDFRGILQGYVAKLKKDDGLVALMAPEIEGFLLKGVDAEQSYDSRNGFELVSGGGYFHSLPLDELKIFIDKTAEAQRAMGFRNEKDHPEVAPSQFEINFSYTDAVRACDQALLYKLVCRQIAMSMGMTATFLPKPIAGINGSGMHTNFSLSKSGRNVFYDKKGRNGLSKAGWDFVDRVLAHAPELSLIFNSSVNSYRRLDPKFEAPNQIKVSSSDRGSMVRLPLGNEKSTRIEVRSVSPDANPYLVLLALIKTGLGAETAKPQNPSRPRLRFLPGTIHDAIRIFRTSNFTTELLGQEAKDKYLVRKVEVAARSPRDLGGRIKAGEVIYHHEVTNQSLWNSF